jgi:carboxyl-terminal processing protease
MFIRGRYLILGLILTIVLSSGLTVAVLQWTGTSLSLRTVDGLNDPQFSKLLDAYKTLKQEYYQDVKNDQLLNGAIDGMIKSLDDPYSTYMNQTEAEAFHENISSSFEGIGAQIREEDGKIVIEAPIKGSPAEKAGLKPNDKILKVDGKSLEGMSVSEAVTYIRGKKDTKAELVIERPGVSEPMNITVIRDKIPLETVYYEMLPEQMGKIQITKFSESTYDEFKKAYDDLKGQGMKGLILDLRQNPGGLLNVTTEIANMLIPDGKPILQVEHRDGKKDIYRASGGKPEFPIVALIDGGSASAAEILAGALQESGGYPLVGEKSFGKGTVQTAKDFSDGSNMKYTIAKWLTPNGNWIHKKGIEPDYQVSLPSYAQLPYIDPDKKFELNNFSSEIKTIQQMLVALGYQPGREDGYFDQQTQEAVLAFQKVQSLPATGIVEGKTTVRMMDLLEEKIQQNDTQLEKAKAVLRKMLP